MLMFITFIMLSSPLFSLHHQQHHSLPFLRNHGHSHCRQQQKRYPLAKWEKRMDADARNVASNPVSLPPPQWPHSLSKTWLPPFGCALLISLLGTCSSFKWLALRGWFGWSLCSSRIQMLTWSQFALQTCHADRTGQIMGCITSTRAE